MLNKSKIIIFVIILLSVITRFLWLDKTAFFVSDQGRDMMVLHNIVINRSLTLIGPATSFAGNYGNIYFGPYYYYFLLPFYLLNSSPYFITAIFPLLFIIGLCLFFKIKELKFNEKITIALLLISSSFSLYYTRFIWNLNLAFILSFILFNIFLIYRKKITGNSLFMLIFGIASGATFQIHYAMFFLYICLPIFFIRSWKNLFLYASGFVISFFPFLLFDLRHAHVLSKNIYSLIFGFHPLVKVVNITFLQIFAKIFNYLLMPANNFNSLIKSLLMMFVYISIIIFNLRRKKIFNYFIAGTFIVFLISFSIFKRDFDYYLACFYIWFYLGAGMMIYSLFKKRFSKIIISFIMLFFVTTNLYNYFSQSINPFGLSVQTKIASEIKNISTISKDSNIFINVYPNQDDVRGLQYLLLTTSRLKISDNADIRFHVCYYRKCLVNLGAMKNIYTSKDVSVFYLK